MPANEEKSNGVMLQAGRYANSFEIGHNAFEFVLDFGRQNPESEHPEFHTRLIISPKLAMSLVESLQEAIDRYRRAYETDA